MRAIAIVLGDNDFGNTFIPLLQSLNEAIKHQGIVDEEFVRQIIAEGIRFHYLAFQVGMDRSQSQWDEATIQRTMEYLNNPKILFDEEADNDATTKDHDHGAWHLDLITGTVTPY